MTWEEREVKTGGESEIIVRLKDTSVEETLDSMEEKDDKTRSEKKKKNQVEKDLDTFPKRERCFHEKHL